jgi:NAD(P)-dependent dehydrogenase (short-subunit alcohol dehydrogenase family)
MENRVAVVTGASSGLGRRFAEVLAREGAKVVAAARRLDRLEELAAEEEAIVAVKCDVSVPADRERLIATALDRFGQIDVCVNNAGISSAAATGGENDLAGFRRVVEVNVDAVFAICRQVGLRMLERGAGSIVNVSSMFGQVASSPLPDAGYVASKHAVNGLTRELGVQWANQGVRVNAIAPGWFASEMTGPMLEDERLSHWMNRNCPMGRIGRPDELDGVLLFLASDASTYCTGQIIAIDGGWTAR